MNPRDIPGVPIIIEPFKSLAAEERRDEILRLMEKEVDKWRELIRRAYGCSIIE